MTETEEPLGPESSGRGAGGRPDVTAANRPDVTTVSIGGAKYLSGPPLLGGALLGGALLGGALFSGGTLYLSGALSLSDTPLRLREQIASKIARIHSHDVYRDLHMRPIAATALNTGSVVDLSHTAWDDRTAHFPAHLRGQVDHQMFPRDLRHPIGQRSGRSRARVLAQAGDIRLAEAGRGEPLGCDRDAGDTDPEVIVLGVSITNLNAPRVPDDNQGVPRGRLRQATEGIAATGLAGETGPAIVGERVV